MRWQFRSAALLTHRAIPACSESIVPSRCPCDSLDATSAVSGDTGRPVKILRQCAGHETTRGVVLALRKARHNLGGLVCTDRSEPPVPQPSPPQNLRHRRGHRLPTLRHALGHHAPERCPRLSATKRQSCHEHGRADGYRQQRWSPMQRAERRGCDRGRGKERRWHGRLRGQLSQHLLDESNGHVIVESHDPLLQLNVRIAALLDLAAVNVEVDKAPRAVVGGGVADVRVSGPAAKCAVGGQRCRRQCQWGVRTEWRGVAGAGGRAWSRAVDAGGGYGGRGRGRPTSCTAS